MTTRVETFKTSYAEVLAALKHQDDKLNRTLTALAFLTAAGITVFVNLNDPEDPVRFAQAGPEVDAVLFVVFMAAVALALLTALAAIGPGNPLSKAEDTRKSLLYFAHIARDGWGWTENKTDEQLAEELASNFRDEALNIAHRVRYKVARARESSAFLQLAIVALGLLGIFETRALNMTARWWIAGGFVTVVLLLQFLELRQMKEYRYVKSIGHGIYYWLLAAVVVAAALMIWAQATTDDYWVALGYALIVLLLSRFATIDRTIAKRLIAVAVGAAAPAVIIAVCL